MPPVGDRVLADILRACGVVDDATIRRWQEALYQAQLASRQRPEDSPPVAATIAVDAYIDSSDSNTARRILDALDDLAALLGYDGPIEEQWFTGSVWRRAMAKMRNGIRSEEVQDRLLKAERALEILILEGRQADVDARTAEAVSQVVTSLAEVPQACLRVGSILIVKYYDGNASVLCSRRLTQAEMHALDRYPEIQTKPQSVLNALAMTIASSEANHYEEP